MDLYLDRQLYQEMQLSQIFVQMHMVNEHYQQTSDSGGDWLGRGWGHSDFEPGIYLHL